MTEYRPYPTDDLTLAKLRQALAKYNPGPGHRRPARVVNDAAPLRRGLRLLAWVGVVGTALELALLRHWDGTVQLLPWAALAALVVALTLFRHRPPAARAIAILVALIAVVGIVEHVAANQSADARYAARWATMSAASRWWAAASGGVGPSPALAPAVLAQSAACLFLSTARTRRRSMTPHPRPSPPRGDVDRSHARHHD